ncbi:Met-10+ like-protein-domain-containing protein [Dunaliella salina]|uniref:tRNA (guanine(37)-N1)-methyltransferase n=1 Tax=Dunaliella salina TaxID=3046 RepID=A0ABQ7FYL0_DUNSA|nr:Met-10+ like-protein-domain-containing protein [Dunaliella salina]|eukprot:KAF5827454.1 Met-10+ like-protein-domain-containing protein [Dunaliella salina]
MEGFEVVKDFSLQLDYSHLNADHVLKALLPEGVDAPSSFETVGHIIHLNLRENQLPYKYIIGQVLLDKNPHVKTVVNKVGNIDNTFRVFAMELLAGEPRTEAEVMQHGIRFRLDLAQVYWNSRLEAEHHRLVQQYFEPKEVIADIMAGVGPFAIPAALQGCTVYANDLNPSSTHYLRINARLNRVTGAVHPFTLDGREFVRLLCTTPSHRCAAAAEMHAFVLQVLALTRRYAAVELHMHVLLHAVMNLPASAIEFVDAFNGAFDPATWSGRLPLVHLYTFKTAAESEADVLDKMQRIMGGQFEAPPTVHWVRDVSPGKIMLCVTFRVPEAVAFNGRQGNITAKEQCVAEGVPEVGKAAVERKEEGSHAHCTELGTNEAKRQRT